MFKEIALIVSFSNPCAFNSFAVYKNCALCAFLSVEITKLRESLPLPILVESSEIIELITEICC